MDTRISQKGTKTRTRQATHGSLLASSLRCPQCGCSHVIRCVHANRSAAFMCGACSHFFDAEKNLPATPQSENAAPEGRQL